MKNMLRKLIAATAICALCAVTALPASAADGTALTLDQFVGLARLVYNQANPSDAVAKMGSVVSKTVEKTGSVDEIAAALAAAVVAREDADSEPLFEGIVAAAGDDAERAAATLLAVTSSTGTMPELDGDVSILSEEETAALTELYKKVLAALRPDKYAMKEDRDGVGASLGAPGAGDQTGTGADGTAGGSDGTDGGATAGGADGTDGGATAGGADGTDGGATAGGSDGTDGGATAGGADGTDGGTDGGTTAGGTDGGTTAGGTDGGATEGTGDDTSDTTNPVDIIQNDPYEPHTTPTTLSGSGIYVPGIHSPTTTTTVPTKPTKPTKPVKPVTPTTSPSPTPKGLR